MDYLFLLGVLSGIVIFALHVTAASSFPQPLSANTERIFYIFYKYVVKKRLPHIAEAFLHYPRATSRIIITTKPMAVVIVPVLLCSPA